MQATKSFSIKPSTGSTSFTPVSNSPKIAAVREISLRGEVMSRTKKHQELCEFGGILLNPSPEALLFLGNGREPWKKTHRITISPTNHFGDQMVTEIEKE